MDDAIEAFLKAHEISYEIAAPYKKEKIK